MSLEHRRLFDGRFNKQNRLNRRGTERHISPKEVVLIEISSRFVLEEFKPSLRLSQARFHANREKKPAGNEVDQCIFPRKRSHRERYIRS